VKEMHKIQDLVKYSHRRDIQLGSNEPPTHISSLPHPVTILTVNFKEKNLPQLKSKFTRSGGVTIYGAKITPLDDLEE
jgi:hypothetical protein